MVLYGAKYRRIKKTLSQIEATHASEVRTTVFFKKNYHF